MEPSQHNVNDHLNRQVRDLYLEAYRMNEQVQDEVFRTNMKNILMRLQSTIEGDKRLNTTTANNLIKMFKTCIEKTQNKMIILEYENRQNFGLNHMLESTRLSTIYGASQSNGVTYGMSICYDSYSSNMNMRHATNNVFDAQERIALKYPRKKYNGDSSASTIATASNNSLYKRRHEVFPQNDNAQTYAEHRLRKIAEKNILKESSEQPFYPGHNTQSTPAANSNISISSSTRNAGINGRRNGKQEGHLYDGINSSGDVSLESANNINSNSYQLSKHSDNCNNMPITNSTRNEGINECKNRKLQEHIYDDINLSDDVSLGSADNTNSTDSQTTPSYKNNNTSISNRTRNAGLKQRRNEKQEGHLYDVIQPSDDVNLGSDDAYPTNSGGIQSSGKKASDSDDNTRPMTHASGSRDNHQNVANAEKLTNSSKAKIRNNNRELHDLLSYTVEIMIDGQRKTMKKNSSESNNDDLLKKHGISKELRVVLEHNNLPQQFVAQRTRSKSIDCSKLLKTMDSVKSTYPEKTTIRRNRSTSIDKLPSVKNAKSRTAIKKPTDTCNKQGTEYDRVKPDCNNTFGAIDNENATTTHSEKVKKQTKTSSALKKQAQPTSESTSASSSKRSRSHGNTHQKSDPSQEEVVLTQELIAMENVEIPNYEETSSASKKRARPTSGSTRASSSKRSRNHGKTHRQGDPRQEEIVITQELSTIEIDEIPNYEETTASKRNNDLNVHCHSDFMQQCCICGFKGNDIVSHYVYQHSKSSVYVSRLAPEQAEIIRIEPMIVTGQEITSRFYGWEPSILFRCHFCNLRINTHKEEWLVHLSSHTGEYRYKCRSCPTLAMTEHSEVTHHMECFNPCIELWEDFNIDNNHVYGHMCNKCNFVQIKYENMVRHIRHDHADEDGEGITFMKISLLNYST